MVEPGPMQIPVVGLFVGGLLSSTYGAGSGLEWLLTVTVSGATSSVTPAPVAVDGTNSDTLAVTVTLSPTATVGALLVNTNTPSDVVKSPSPTGSCMKKPFVLSAVTTLFGVVTVWPSSGEAVPWPWICMIVYGTGSSFWIVPVADRLAGLAFEPARLLTLTLKVSSGSKVVSPLTSTLNV